MKVLTTVLLALTLATIVANVFEIVTDLITDDNYSFTVKSVILTFVLIIPSSLILAIIYIAMN